MSNIDVAGGLPFRHVRLLTAESLATPPMNGTAGLPLIELFIPSC
jgi:hypothetical protein